MNAIEPEIADSPGRPPVADEVGKPPARFRLPAPHNGWPAFLHEIMVVVIGVLLALALGAVAEELSWRQKASDGETRLRAELAANAGQAAEQIIATPCILAQLDAIREHLVREETQPLPLDNYPNNLAVLRLPTRPYARNIWLALQQDGTTAHLSLDRQRYLGSFYGYVDTMAVSSLASGDASGRLLLLGYPGTLTAQTRSDLLQITTEQYRRTQAASRIAAQMIATLRDIGLAPTREEIAARVRRASNTFSSDTIGFCRARGLPLGDWEAAVARVAHISERPI